MRIVLVFATALVLAACSAATPVSTTSSTTTTTSTSSTTTTTVAVTTSTTLPELPEPIFAVAPDVFEAAPDLDSYRSQATLVISTEPAGSGIVDFSSTVAGEFLREPPSVSATVTVNDELVVDVIGIDGTYWLGEEGVWVEDPSAQGLLGLAGAQLVDPDDLSAVSGTMQLSGVEEVNGRPSRRFVGSSATIAALVARSDGAALQELGRLDLAESEVWLDESGFIIKARFSFGGVNELSGLVSYYLVEIELLDFNEPVEINPPA